MAPLVLEGRTLGEKHRSYNKLVNEGYEPNETAEADDIGVLVKIDIASKKRDVNYILDVLKSEDQLYVSKAIKRSAWLITDPQYAHIINPEHLYTNLRPQMTTQAFNKLILNVRLHLKDHNRVEEFYNHAKKDNADLSYKWLQHCSTPFVEKEVVKHGNNIPDRLLVRLFDKSFSIFQEYTLRSTYRYSNRIMNEAEFLVIKYPEQFLDFLKSLKDGFYFNFSKKSTKTLMEKCPEKVIDDFELYGNHLDLVTFAKYLGKKKENIEEFLFKHADNEKMKWLYSYDNIQHFVHNMPKETRFDFAKKVFIDKEIFQNPKDPKPFLRNKCAMWQCGSLGNSSQNANNFKWYKFAPFEIAFTEIKKLIRAESNPTVRVAMFQVLIKCAGQNMSHLNTLLQYYNDRHINEPFKFKIQFVNYVMSQVNPRALDDKGWKLLNQLFHSMEVYIASENNVQSCIKFILVKNIIHKEEIPEIIKQKFIYDSLKKMQDKLKTKEDRDAVFDFLYKITFEKYNKLDITLKQEFDEAVSLCKVLLNLINDWNRQLNDYPQVVETLKKLIDVNKNKKWNKDLSLLYNTKKSWKRMLFEASVDLQASESVCINALKHDPELLSRHKNVIVAMCANDSVSLRLLLRKIRIYWSGSLAEEWKKIYLERIEQPEGHKALIGGLCTLLPQKELNGFLKKYAPSEKKIDWNDTDQRILSLRKQIAKNAVRARPLASIDEILPYAKGDYLQFAVPSVSAILSQLSADKCRQIIPKLLDAPVSLQKFGIRCAFHKLNTEELKPVLNDIWNSTKNPSIRAVLFNQVFAMLRKEENNEVHAKIIWGILSMLIDKLTSEEDKSIYQKLGDISKVPACVKPQFFMKSYTFLSSLPAKCNGEDILRRIIYVTTDVMDSLDDDFVVDVLLKDVCDTITKGFNVYDKARLFSSFILSSQNEEMQIRRYQKSLEPVLKQVLPDWENIHDGTYCIKQNIKRIYEKVYNDIDIFTFDKKMQIPLATFELMGKELESSLTYQKEYVFLTTWKLGIAFMKALSHNSQVITNFERSESDDNEMTPDEKDKMYHETHKQVSPAFAELCVQYLKEDLQRFGSSIYVLFFEAFTILFRDYLCCVLGKAEHRLLYAKCLIKYRDVKEVWLFVAMFLQLNKDELYSDETKKIVEEMREIVNSDASDEVKIHFNNIFSSIVPFVPDTTNKESVGGCKF